MRNADFRGGSVRVYRLIFRLDLQQPSFEIINSPGTVMRIINDMGDKYWPELLDDATNRRIIAKSTDAEKGTFRQISAEPTSMNFVFESAEGIDIDSLDTDKNLAILFKGISALCDNFKINEILRAGIRFTMLSSLKEDNPNLKFCFGELFDSQLIRKVTSRLGAIKDYGFVLEGEDLDKLSYRCQLGPYEVSEANKYFSATTAKKMEENSLPVNLIYDLDLYEAKFAMTVSAAKWSMKPRLKAKQLSAEIESYLSERI